MTYRYADHEFFRLKVLYDSNKYHTSLYDNLYYVMRRNSSCVLAIDHDPPLTFNKERINVNICYSVWDSITTFVLNMDNPTQHHFTLNFSDEYWVDHVFLMASHEAYIGKYTVWITYEKYVSYSIEIFLIFNPYDDLDDAYILNLDHYEKYLNETSLITYQTGKDGIRHMPFQLQQFTRLGLKTTNTILEKTPFEERNIAALVARNLSRWVNSDGFCGILVGNWNMDSMARTFTTSTVEHVLKKFLKSRVGPVGYGQCMDFNVLLCSFLRTVGIGCRVVTGRVIPVYLSYNDEQFVEINIDDMEITFTNQCKWNSHVWCNVYIRRRELINTNSKFDGWQFLDGTPSFSHGFMPCGPYPLSAMSDPIRYYNVPFDFERMQAHFRNCIKAYLTNTDRSLRRITMQVLKHRKMYTQGLIDQNPIDVTDEHYYPLPVYFKKLNIKYYTKIITRKKILFTDNVKINFFIATSRGLYEKKAKMEVECWFLNSNIPNIRLVDKLIIFHQENFQQKFSLKLDDNPLLIENNFFLNVNLKFYEPYTYFLKLNNVRIDVLKYKLSIVKYQYTEGHQYALLYFNFKNILEIPVEHFSAHAIIKNTPTNLHHKNIVYPGETVVFCYTAPEYTYDQIYVEINTKLYQSSGWKDISCG